MGSNLLYGGDAEDIYTTAWVSRDFGIDGSSGVEVTQLPQHSLVHIHFTLQMMEDLIRRLVLFQELCTPLVCV